jgi:hypothetical protein
MEGETMKGDILPSLDKVFDRAMTLSRDSETVVNAIETARKEMFRSAVLDDIFNAKTKRQ